MKLIMIDLDGTLIDTRMVNYLSYKEAMEPYGYSIDYRYYCNFCNGRYYLDFLPGITTDDQNVLSAIHKHKTSAYRKYLSEAVVNWTLVDIAKHCKPEYKVALVTTASKRNTYDILEKFQLVDIFDLILTREDVTKSKPDPEGYIKAMDFFGASGEESIIFEDSDVGVEAAKRAGAHVYIVSGYN